VQPTTSPTAAPHRAFLARMYDTIRGKLRRLFGKKDGPNIYPFF
jgi:hypothetical protein